MKLLFVHGWGFDASLWDPVVACMPGADVLRADLGYFGPACWPGIDGPCLAITHSFGAMALLADPPAECRGLVAINGFDRFAEGPDREGIAPRVLDRMIARLDIDPVGVLRDFHARLGSAMPAGDADAGRLMRDLCVMRGGDTRAALERWERPVVALDGGEDPLMPPGMRQAQFDLAADMERETVEGGGHLLPLTHPRLCAAWIEGLRAAA